MESLALLTDPYELTMAYGYWKLGMASREAVFHLFYRSIPFQGNFVVAAGLHSVIECIANFSFSESDLAYLATLKDLEGAALFEEEFLSYLGELRLEVDVDAVPEGRFVFPHEPLLRVRGPLLHAQILETVLLNLVNYQSLVATKAANIRMVAGDDQVMEFGLRRAHGPYGGVLGSRAAYIGGCDSVSNVLAGKRYGIPVRGTHAHSWVMAFDSERESFEGWAGVMPGNCYLLLDTYDTPKALEKAIEIGKKQKLHGVRLDSGDLLSLGKLCREALDAAGLHDAKIVASNELDERVIADLKAKGSPIAVWGVGTRLATGHPKAALDGVYKLSAIKDNQWKFKAKRSDQPEKTSPPGVLQVRRYVSEGKPIGDVIYNIFSKSEPHIGVYQKEKRDFSHAVGEDLLVPIFRGGRCVYDEPPIEEMRRNTLRELAQFPKEYFVGTEERLEELKHTMVGESWTWDKVEYVT